jgi:hypothetical protein
LELNLLKECCVAAAAAASAAAAGEGRVHTCLRFNLKLLSERCAAEENKLSAVEYRDIRLRPKLARVCSEERAVYCKVSGTVGGAMSST